MGRTEDLKQLVEMGQYEHVIDVLRSDAYTPAELRLLGLAYLRGGQVSYAELPLLQAHLRGDPEASVEYGNYLRFVGRYQDACAHFAEVAPTAEGELGFRCARWWGVAQIQMGDSEKGLERLERSWYGYMAFDDPPTTARVTNSLAQMLLRLGHFVRAEHYFHQALRQLPEFPTPHPRLTALHGLMDLQLQLGDYPGVEASLKLVDRALKYTDSPIEHAMALAARTELQRMTGELDGYTENLVELSRRADTVQDFELRLWVTAKLSEHHSAQGRFSESLVTLVRFGTPQEEWPAELRAAHGILLRRQGQLVPAREVLERAAAMFREQGRMPGVIRVCLHAAAAALSMNQHEAAMQLLNEALTEMVRMKLYAEYHLDFEELQALINSALLDLETAPMLEPVLDVLAHMAGTPRLPEDSLMILKINTLGRISVLKDGTEVALSHRGVLTLVYVFLHPGRTRTQLGQELYPDVDPLTSDGYVRSAIAELREKMGREAVTFSGPKNALVYHLGNKVQCALDLEAFREAAARGDTTRMVALYRGEFLPGVHDCAWVTTSRAEVLTALTTALRVQLTRHEMEGDWHRVVVLANQYLKFDAYDPDVLELRVRAAQAIGNPQDIARYSASLKRTYN
jgi:tetratricopeptide (TPR) repeat protein/DNA-binding SARP family transcriptional activator